MDSNWYVQQDNYEYCVRIILIDEFIRFDLEYNIVCKECGILYQLIIKFCFCLESGLSNGEFK